MSDQLGDSLPKPGSQPGLTGATEGRPLWEAESRPPAGVGWGHCPRGPCCHLRPPGLWIGAPRGRLQGQRHSPAAGSLGDKGLPLTCPRVEAPQLSSALHSFEFLLVPFTCWAPPSLLPAPCLPVLVSLGCPSKMPHTGDLCFMEAEKSKAKAKTPFLKMSFQAGRLPPPHRGRRAPGSLSLPLRTGIHHGGPTLRNVS